MISIRHEPFGRTALKRKVVPNPGKYQECTWCGQSPKLLYRYGAELDGGRFQGYHKGRFCNVDCHDAYHGGPNA